MQLRKCKISITMFTSHKNNVGIKIMVRCLYDVVPTTGAMWRGMRLGEIIITNRENMVAG
jgi:uridine phosphorylase